MSKQVIKDIKKLVSFKTVSGVNNQEPVLKLYNWYKKRIKRSDYKFKIFEHNGFNSLIVEPKEARKGTSVVLLAHIDVVSASSSMFKVRENRGKLFGRGVFDMKFAAAVFLELINNCDAFSSKNIKIILVSDEEVGGFDGVQALLKCGDLKTDIVILPDGGADFKIVKAAKGLIHLEVSAKGKKAHGSRPWEGKNACEYLINGYQKLAQEFNDFKKGYWTNTLNLGKAFSGDTTNTVPDKAVFNLDIRYTDDYTQKMIMQKVKESFGKDCLYKTITTGDNFSLDTKNIFIKKMIETVEKHTGKQVVFKLDHGSSDARWFTKYGIPVAIFQPNGGDIHTNDEWIEIKSLEKFTKVLAEYLINI